MNEDALRKVRERRENIRQHIAEALHDANLAFPAVDPWPLERQDVKAHWLQLANIALDVVERLDDGLLEWLATAEGRSRERMGTVSRALDALADSSVSAHEPGENDPVMNAAAAEIVRAMARRLSEPFELPPRRTHGQQP